MENRYLYRAKRTDNGEWITGYLLVKKKDFYICEKPYECMDEYSSLNGQSYGFGGFKFVDPSTICQCTGLRDKNGKLIWENDIVEAWSQGRCAIGKIKHRIDGTWIMYPEWQNGELWYLLPNDDGITTVEVIGNIFDNKELLESEDKDENNY